MLDSEMMDILKDMEDRYTEAAVILEGMEDDRFSRRAKALRLAREKLEQHRADGWFSGLPEPGRVYLFTFKEPGEKPYVLKAHYAQDGAWWEKYITHWMPLPEPAKEINNDT